MVYYIIEIIILTIRSMIIDTMNMCGKQLCYNVKIQTYQLTWLSGNINFILDCRTAHSCYVNDIKSKK